MQVEMPVGTARPFRVAGSAPPRMVRAKNGMPLDSAGRTR
jgi:hypothetical protein